MSNSEMKSNSSVSVTCTLNADDILELIDEGQLKDKNIVIGTTDPELARLHEIIDRKP